MGIGLRIQKMRNKKGITQLQLSKGTGIDVTLISKYENEVKEIGLDNLTRIAEFMNLSLDYLVYGEGPAYKVFDDKPSWPNIFHELEKKRRGTFVKVNRDKMPKIIQSVIDEIADIRTWGCLSYSGEDEAIVMLENHSKLFYKALELGLFEEAFNMTFDELEKVLIENGVDIKPLISAIKYM